MADAKPREPQRPMASTLEEFRYLQQVYQNQYMALTQELSGSADRLRELDAAQKTLENMDSVKEKDTLVSIGYGTYVNSRITNGDTVLVSVGAGYMVEKKVDEAKAYISSALDQETTSINKLNKAKKELESALIEIAYKIDELSH